MNKKITFIILFGLSTLYANDEIITLNTSSYTSIAQKDCITLDSDNMGSIQECESFSKIKIKVIEGDIRQSIILTRNQKEYDLAFSSTVSPSFSSLGFRVEWRHELGKSENLIGMIVRVETSDDYENLDKVFSYLIVSKITKNEICVVAKVRPKKGQNKIARDILDSREELPCLRHFKKERDNALIKV